MWSLVFSCQCRVLNLFTLEETRKFPPSNVYVDPYLYSPVPCCLGDTHTCGGHPDWCMCRRWNMAAGDKCRRELKGWARFILVVGGHEQGIRSNLIMKTNQREMVNCTATDEYVWKHRIGRKCTVTLNIYINMKQRWRDDKELEGWLNGQYSQEGIGQ